MGKDFSELDLQLVMYDFNDTEEEREDNVVAGVAIRAEDAEAFAADVERLAVEKYGGATFAGLLDEDLNDDSMVAAQQRKDAARNEALLAEAERVLDAGLPEEAQKRRPMPSVKGKTLEQVKMEYEEATRRWEELQADPEGYGESELRERLLDYVDAGLCVDMAMRRDFNSMDPQARSEMLKLLAQNGDVFGELLVRRAARRFPAGGGVITPSAHQIRNAPNGLWRHGGPCHDRR